MAPLVRAAAILAAAVTVVWWATTPRADRPAPAATIAEAATGKPTLQVATPGTLALPFDPAEQWVMTTGPHCFQPASRESDRLTDCARGAPPAALDFMPWDAGPCVPVYRTVAGAATATLLDYETACYCRPSSLFVRAPGPGVVDYIEPGVMVSVMLDDGRAFAAYHLTDDLAAKGTRVNTGDPLGRPGCVGATTGAHAHVAVSRDGVWLPAPAEWIR